MYRDSEYGITYTTDIGAPSARTPTARVRTAAVTGEAGTPGSPPRPRGQRWSTANLPSPQTMTTADTTDTTAAAATVISAPVRARTGAARARTSQGYPGKKATDCHSMGSPPGVPASPMAKPEYP